MSELHIHIVRDAEAMAEVRRINHRVYAEELGQDRIQADGRSASDPRMAEGVCFLVRDGERAVGMLALTLPHQRFSLEDAVGVLPITVAQRARTVELRRLAILPSHRGRGIYVELVDAVMAYCLSHGYRYACISAIVDRVPMYARLGFVPFGPRFRKGSADGAGTEPVEYQPMLLDPRSLQRAGLSSALFPHGTEAIAAIS